MYDLTDRHALHSRLIAPAAEPPAGLDPDFDTVADDLGREFQEPRLQLGRFE